MADVDSDSGNSQRARQHRPEHLPPELLPDHLTVTSPETWIHHVKEFFSHLSEIRDRGVDDPVEEIRVWVIDVAVIGVES